jgi:hypothetical protein
MKNKKFNKRLGLNKATVANLSNYELNYVRGGVFTNETVCRACNTEGIACRPTTPCTGSPCVDTDYSICVCLTVGVGCS